MKNINLKRSLLLAAAMLALSGKAFATPSTQVWIPSPDIQKWKTAHIGVDNYTTVFITEQGGSYAYPTDVGLTLGVIPSKAFGLELGVDMFQPSDYPWYFNAKMGLREGEIAEWFPGVAVGIYNVGTEVDATNYNIAYGLIGKNVWKLGRFSAGYYYGNPDLLVDEDGDEAPDGVLVSWDRTMSEISDKLWLAVDYQGGENSFGAVSAGVAWYFAPNVSLLVGYDWYTMDVNNTLTIQLDIELGKSE